MFSIINNYLAKKYMNRKYTKDEKQYMMRISFFVRNKHQEYFNANKELGEYGITDIFYDISEKRLYIKLIRPSLFTGRKYTMVIFLIK